MHTGELRWVGSTQTTMSEVITPASEMTHGYARHWRSRDNISVLSRASATIVNSFCQWATHKDGSGKAETEEIASQFDRELLPEITRKITESRHQILQTNVMNGGNGLELWPYFLNLDDDEFVGISRWVISASSQREAWPRATWVHLDPAVIAGGGLPELERRWAW